MNTAATSQSDREPDQSDARDEDGLLGRLELIESQPLDQRAAGFEQLHDELLTELQRSDQEEA
ncbi:MAG: hypothetical protein ACTIJ6_08710 [Leucobacter sp.]